jgi:hypothetical protein
MKNRLLYVNAIIEYESGKKKFKAECKGILIKEGDKTLSSNMCKQCRVKEGKIIKYEIIREISF